MCQSRVLLHIHFAWWTMTNTLPGTLVNREEQKEKEKKGLAHATIPDIEYVSVGSF